MTSSNITNINPGQKLHIFITSLYSQNFFYHYEFFEKHPSNMQLEDKDKIAVRWWYPDILFDYHEPVTRFELFRRQMRIGYSKFGESLASAVVIVPSNFNDIEQNFDVDAIYGDKIVILTKNLAKLYYILSKIIEAKKEEFIGDRNVIIIFVQEKSIIGELYKVGNREFYLLERIEILIPSSVNANKDESKNEQQKTPKKTADPEITLYSIIAEVRERLNKNKEKFAFTVVFKTNADGKKLDSTKLEDYFFVDETKTENEILREGALFKAQTDFEGNSYTFVDNTKKLPYFNIVYPLLNDRSSYRPITEAFGIDLGTSRSASTVHRLYGTDYEINILHDEFDEGTLLYSWVAFDKDEKQPICGRSVYERFGSKAEYIVFDCKKLIGKSIDEIQQSDEWKFKVVDDKGNVKIQVKSKDQGKEIDILVTPEEVYTIMLERFQTNAMKFINTNIKKAVFTVPSNFGQREKAAMRKAAKVAKIEVLRFLPEPTAAALSYCSRMKEKPKNNDLIFVFDLGGGTFDISIFKIENLRLIQICQHSNAKLGGTKFNEMLYNYVVKELKDEHNLEIGKKKHDLWIQCTDAKEQLTDLDNTNICVGEIDIDITRDEFEVLCEPLIVSIKESINFSLKKANIKADDITYVIKVGGSCAMQMIESLIRDTFPNSKLEDSDPQHEVAFGAALYASAILPQQKIKTDFIKNYWPL